MISLGLAIKKDEIWYSIIEGTSRENASIIEIGKERFRSESDTLMMDFKNIFLEIITKYNPNIISYKLSLDINLQQIPYMHYSLGVLNLICLQQNIKVQERSSRWITAGKQSKIKEFQKNFNNISFKNEKLAASLIAWFGMEG